VRKAVLGVVIAAGAAFALSGAAPFGIDAWKIVLAIAGLVIVVSGVRS
jgi:hypothetical protein